MSECIFTRARSEQREDIIDFIDFVFSKKVTPHDFRSLYPSVYGDRAPDFTPWHYIAQEGTKIRGVVGMRHTPLHVCGRKLNLGYIGSVSVHPQFRNQGYMAQLMNLAISDAEKLGYDMLVLGGQRQRYGYYGFEQGGQEYRFTVTRRNLAGFFQQAASKSFRFEQMDCPGAEALEFFRSLHASSPVHAERPRFEESMQTAGRHLTAVFCAGRLVGYIGGAFDEWAFTDSSILPYVLCAYMEHFSVRTLSLKCALWETDRIRCLMDFAESAELGSCLMIRVMNWGSVLSALLPLRAQFSPLPDTEICLAIGEHTPLRLQIRNGQVQITHGSAPDIHLSEREALQEFFSPFAPQLLSPADPLFSLCPLPFSLGYADSF